MSEQKKTNKVILTILDGWGYTKDHPEYNAIKVGNTPTWDNLLKNNPSSNLITFGKEVGLPDGQMGNSEVGHINIGAGRVVFQDLPRINNSIENKEFQNNSKIKNTINQLKNSSSRIHIMGLFSPGGVHSHYKHLLYSAELFAKSNVNVVLHLFTDGRDTPPTSAKELGKELENMLHKYSNISIGTVSGRYYSMDRDKRWERIKLAYDAIVNAKSEDSFSSFNEVLQFHYDKNISDEFINPSIIKGYVPMKDQDSIFMINFRTDRARQILESLLLQDFTGFHREKILQLRSVLGMVSYSENLDKMMNTVFSNIDLTNTIGEWLAKHNLSQLRVAETEKYPHVTFFFGGGREKPYNKEERILIDSPKVATYDLQPEMSAYEITDQLVSHMSEKQPDFIVVNYANGDMVGHTGVLQAARKAAETVDNCLEKLHKSVIENDYIWLIIADHGNCETMWDFENNVPHTQHTTNLVKAVLYNQVSGKNYSLQDGKLADIAPTILELMNMKQPEQMNGLSLIKK